MKIICRREHDTHALGKKISQYLRESDIICLIGNLGSGKTVMTKGIAAGLGLKDDEVNSPTFVLIRQYRGRLLLNHFDLYRLGTALDISELGYEDYMYGEGVSVIEWADKLGCLAPREYLGIDIRIGRFGQRIVRFEARGARYEQLLKEIKKSL